MKLALILVAAIGVTLASPITEVRLTNGVRADGDLRYVLDRLLVHIDLVTLEPVLGQLLFETDQGSIVVLYLRGAGFGRIIDAFEAEQEVNNILDYIEQNGIPDVREFIAGVFAYLGIQRPHPRDGVSPKADFEELLQQLIACIDQEGLKETALDVLNNVPAAYDFLNYLAREEVGPAWQRIKAQEDLVSLLNLLRSAGIDVDSVIAQIEALFGWGV